jgi:hypothetical protein
LQQEVAVCRHTGKIPRFPLFSITIRYGRELHLKYR